MEKSVKQFGMIAAVLASVCSMAFGADLGVTPATLSFSAFQDGAYPPLQTILLKNRTLQPLDWEVIDVNDVPLVLPEWLSISPLSGYLDPNGLPGDEQEVTVSVFTDGLADGLYSYAFDYLAGIERYRVTVALRIIGPDLQLSSNQFNTVVLFGSPDPDPNELLVSNVGGGTLEWMFADIGGDTLTLPEWLTIAPVGGSLSQGQQQPVFLAYDADALAPGVYEYEFRLVSSAAEPQTIMVTLKIIGPNIRVSSQSYDVQALFGSTEPVVSELVVCNTGGGGFDWTIADAGGSTLNLPAWLSILPVSGSLEMVQGQSVTLSCNPAGLAAGNYQYAFEVLSSIPGLNSPAITVNFDVIGPICSVSKSSLSFYAKKGDSNPSGQSISVINTGGGALNWSIDTTGQPEWLAISQVSGSLGHDQTDTVTFSADIAGLAEGRYSWNSTFIDVDSGGAPVPLTVTLVVDYAEYRWSTNPGTGELYNPYQISTPAQLMALRQDSFNPSRKHFILTSDIDMSSVSLTACLLGHLRFTLDGNGYAISNLTLNATQAGLQNAGLFLEIDEIGVIRNLNLRNLSVSSTAIVTGGLAARNFGVVENCSVTGSITGIQSVGGCVGYNFGKVSNCRAYCTVISNGGAECYVGGLIGCNGAYRSYGTTTVEFYGRVRNCSFSGTVSAASRSTGACAGGLIGRNTVFFLYWTNKKVKVSHCHASAEVSGYNNVGGLIGYNYDTAVRSCSADAVVHGNENVGGLIGYIQESALGGCYSEGEVNGVRFVGGLIGQYKPLVYPARIDTAVECFSYSTVNGTNYVGGLAGVSCSLTDCFAAGAVNGYSYVGGLMGIALPGSSIANCYAAAPVTGTNYSGGFAGQNNGTIGSSFWDMDASGLSTGVGGGSVTGVTGASTSDLQDIETFVPAGWDFDPNDGNAATWELAVGSYPAFVWQQNANSGSYSGGDGTESDPYQIDTVSDFLQLLECSGDWDKFFILTANLDLSAVVFTDSPVAWDKDHVNCGFQGPAFSGGFNGNGHIISHLRIQARDKTHIGLFGAVEGGRISNLRIEDAVIEGCTRVGSFTGVNSHGILSHCSTTGQVGGTEYVGGLVGYNLKGIIDHSGSSAVISGSSSVGGIAGENGQGVFAYCQASGPIDVIGTSTYSFAGGLIGSTHGGRIEQSFSDAVVSVEGNDVIAGGLAGSIYDGAVQCAYSSGSVTSQGTSNNFTGGFAGYMVKGSVSFSYNTAAVSAEAPSGSAGGFIGEAEAEAHDIVSCLYDIESSGITYSAAGKPVNSQLMRTLWVFQNAGWANKGWVIDDGSDTPKLAWQDTAGTKIPAAVPFLAGRGTMTDPYRVYTAEEFAQLSWHYDVLDKYINLMNDIDLSGTALFPIGDLGPFRGTFSGNGFTLSNVTIHQPGSDCIGLFSKLGGIGSITRLNLVNADIIGNDFVGALVGKRCSVPDISYTSYVSRCCCTGKVEATGLYAGGLFGYDTGSRSQIRNNVADVSVTGTDYVGGFAGYLALSDYYFSRDCCSLGSVEGDCYAGGFVGKATAGAVSNLYAIGSVSGTEYVGGFAGVAKNQCFMYCYSTGPVSGDRFVYGFGSVADPLYSQGCFWDIQASGTAVGTDPNITAAFLTGLDTPAMFTSSNFINAGWDFTDTDNDPADWMMLREGEDYPRLAWQTVNPGDIAGMYGVDATDLTELADHWLEQNCPTDCEDADIDGNGKVDLADLAILANDWMEQAKHHP